MIEYARLFMPQSEIQFFDPALGTGVFYSALLSIFSKKKLNMQWDLKLTKYIGVRQWIFGTINPPLDLKLADFTIKSAPKSEENKFNLIICNPPYVRHHAMTSYEKLRLATWSMKPWH